MTDRILVALADFYDMDGTTRGDPAEPWVGLRGRIPLPCGGIPGRLDGKPMEFG